MAPVHHPEEAMNLREESVQEDALADKKSANDVHRPTIPLTMVKLDSVPFIQFV